ncbi:MAG: hypothetical protein V1857_02865 [archaeon]
MSAGQKSFLKRLADLDRRLIYVSLIVIVGLMTVAPIGLPLKISGATRLAYETVEKLPSGSIVLFSLDVDIMGWLQGGPQAIAFLQHLFSRPVRVVLIGWRPDSEMLILKTLSKVDSEQKNYGTDYVNLGYVAGGETAMSAFATNPSSVLRTDYYGTAITNIPLMQDVKGAKSISLVINPNTGSPGAVEFIRQWRIPFGVPIITSQPPMTVPEFTPHVQAGNLIAALPAIRSSAEYELLIRKPGLGIAAQDAVSLGSLALLVYIVIGNIGGFLMKRKEARQ